MKKNLKSKLQNKESEINSKMYSDLIMDLWRNPDNYGKIIDANVIENGLNISCGDEVTIYLKENKGVIKDVSFVGKGCAICIASASMITSISKGKKVSELKKLNEFDVKKAIGMEIHPARKNCMMLALTTIQKGLIKNK